jgi:hypothetical protein
MPTDEEVMRRSALLSALAILIHTAIEEINPAAAKEEYYNCEALDCASGLGIAIDSGWLSSGATRNENGSWNNLFLVKLTPKGRITVDDMTVAIKSYTYRPGYSYITQGQTRPTRFDRILEDD